MKKPKPKSVLCFDLGSKRIGLAGCDPLGITIKRIEPIFRKSFEEDIKKIKYICIERQVKGLIFGLPLDDRGKETYQSKIAKKDGTRIARSLELPFVFINEHSTSWEAIDKFNLRKDKNGKVDSASAAIILQQWLREGPEIYASS